MNAFGETLKKWRKQRAMSQLDLSLNADVSTKHLSFLETGRSQPSREMVLHLAHVLDIPLAERNTLLAQSGYAAAYSQRALQHEDMQPVRQALAMLLENQNPYPAMVLDWDWNILMVNQAQQNLAMAVHRLQPDFLDSNNLMELMFHPKGYRPFIRNWQPVAQYLYSRLLTERRRFTDRQSDLLSRLHAIPDFPSHWAVTETQHQQPMLTVELAIADQSLSLFSTLTSFGTPIDITLQELTIEQYFPSDERTRLFFEQLNAAHPTPRHS